MDFCPVLSICSEQYQQPYKSFHCQDNNVELLGKIGFDESIVKAMVEGKTIIEYPDGEAKGEISKIWGSLQKQIK